MWSLHRVAVLTSERAGAQDSVAQFYHARQIVGSSAGGGIDI